MHLQQEGTRMKLWMTLLLLVVTLAVPVSQAANPENVNVMALSGITGLAMVRMIDHPAEQGVRYTFQILKNPDQMMGKIITGEADIAALPTNSAAILYNKGVAIQLASIIGWGVMYLVSDGQSIHRWTDLRGKEVFVPAKGSVPDLLFQYITIKNGLHPETDLKITYISSPAELAQLVIAGKSQLAVLPEPWVTETKERVTRLKVSLDFQKEWGKATGENSAYPQTCVVVRKQFAMEHPELIKDFLRNLEQSIGWVRKNPSQSGALAEKYVQLPAVAVQKGLKRCNLKYSPAYPVRSQVQSFLGKLSSVAPQAVGGKLPDEGFYYHP
jgi:NitT/TauT family transport system substrate-binding protein